MTNVISATEARKNLLKIIDSIDENYTRVDLTKNGKVKATLISPDYLDSLEETIYSLENSMDDIRQAEAEIASGRFVSFEEFHKDLEKRITNEKKLKKNVS